MAARLLAVTFDARDPARLASFWSDVLGRAVVASREEKVGRNRIHLHLTSDSAAHQRHTVATALGLGAHPLDVGQLPEEEHVVLADPEGNEFCVIEPGNAFLAGCGVLGELAAHLGVSPTAEAFAGLDPDDNEFDVRVS